MSNQILVPALGESVTEATVAKWLKSEGDRVNADLNLIDSQGYCFQVDMVRRLVSQGLKIKEVPITFTERTIGTSKMSRNIVLEAFVKIGIWGIKRILGR